jgi:hypothetical protein
MKIEHRLIIAYILEFNVIYRLAILVTMLGLMSASQVALGRQSNGHLYDECHSSLTELEQMFSSYESLTDFNPKIHTHLARMNMLINMVSFCSESGLMPMTETVNNKVKNKVMWKATDG